MKELRTLPQGGPSTLFFEEETHATTEATCQGSGTGRQVTATDASPDALDFDTQGIAPFPVWYFG
jgi:hypothetical protein